MAESAKELAFTLFDEGKRPSDPEVKALGVKRRSTYAYFQDWKKSHPELNDTTIHKPDGSTTGKGGTITPKPSGTTIAPIMVGKITITPENWGMTQYGAILILDTFNKTKRDLDYGGTIGDFICDICEFYRRILNYTEVEYGRATTGEGGGGTQEDGGKSLEPAPRLTEGQ